MTNNNDKQHLLPSREICYAYTVAMHLGQQLEVNLRAILYAADYHGWGANVDLTEEQMKRFKDTPSFIDKATCGLIIEKLRATGIIPDERAWRTFERACEHRNKLAHSFLASQDFDTITGRQETEIMRQLYAMAVDLYEALVISRGVRRRADIQSDEHHGRIQELLREAGFGEYENPNRKYATRKRQQKGI